MDLNLSGKSVVVTGAGSNIGRGIALAFAREGAALTLGDIDASQTQLVAEEAKQLGARSVQFLKTDVTDLDQVTEMMEAANREHGGIDVLVNCAGWDEFHYFSDTTPELWQKIVQINFFGVLNCTSAALKFMSPAKKGAIVSISSDASRQGEPREAVYGGAKAAINSFMKTIAKEEGRSGIRCNVVCPGITLSESEDEIGETSMWQDQESFFTPDQLERAVRALPLRKVGRPQDVANSVLFLASDEVAGHITGQVLSVSGGYTMIG